MSVDVGVVDPHDEAALRSWYDTLHAGATADRVAPLVSSWPAFVRSLQHPGPDLRRLPVAATRDGGTLGAMLVELPLRENRETASVEIDVPPAHRQQGIGQALWRWADGHLAGEGRTVVQTEVHVPAGQTPQTWPGARFAERLGARSENVEDHLVLALPADPEPAGPDDGHRLVTWEGACPEEHLPPYAALRTAMTGDVPTGGLTRDAEVWDADRVRAADARLTAQYVVLVALALAGDGEPAGYTLAFLDRGDPDNALQDDTFVREQHRGHGLGLRLKVANLAQLEQHRGDRRWLHTWTATDNAPMQRVNARFGFRLVERTHEYELDRGR